jgi:hypothetical protein
MSGRAQLLVATRSWTGSNDLDMERLGPRTNFTWSEGLVSRKLRVTLRDALQAVQVLEALEREKGGERTLADYFVQLDHIITVVREVVPEDLQVRIADRLTQLRAERAQAPLMEEPGDKVGRRFRRSMWRPRITCSLTRSESSGQI